MLKHFLLPKREKKIIRVGEYSCFPLKNITLVSVCCNICLRGVIFVFVENFHHCKGEVSFVIQCANTFVGMIWC